MNQHPAEQDSAPHWSRVATSNRDCKLVANSIEAYSLGIADPGLGSAIERHVTSCSDCAALVSTYQHTAVLLGLSARQVAPSAGVKPALLERIAATPQRVTEPVSVFAGDLERFRTPSLPSSSTVAAVTPAHSPGDNAWWRIYAAPLATLPLLLALGLVGAWGFNNYARLNDANGVIAKQEQAIASLSNQRDLDEQQVIQLAFSPSSKRYTMTSELTSANGTSWGTLLTDPVTGQAALQVEGLEAGAYTVLMQTRDGAMVQTAEFIVGPDGTASTAVDLGDQVSDFQSVHIRESNGFSETDVALDGEIVDVLMAIIGPDINQGSGTGLQRP